MGGNTNYDIVPISSGEGFFKEIVYNPLPRNTIPVVIVDYELQSHAHRDAKDGIEILKEILLFRPHWDIVLIAQPNDKKIKNIALKNGAAAFVLKNENSLIRLNNHIITLMNQQKMKVEKQYTIIAIYIFILLFISIGSLFFYFFIRETQI